MQIGRSTIDFGNQLLSAAIAGAGHADEIRAKDQARVPDAGAHPLQKTARPRIIRIVRF